MIYHIPRPNFLFSQKSSLNCFTAKPILLYFTNALANSGASRGKLNTQLAYKCTPINACFFMRSAHTPKESRQSAVILSMVACSGQPLGVGRLPVGAVFHPVARYRLSRGKPSDSPILTTGAIAMIYQFVGVSRQHYNRTLLEQFRVQAQSETQARALLARDYVLTLVGQLPDSAKTNRTLVAGGGAMTTSRFTKSQSAVSIAPTTTLRADRRRYSSGIFLSQVHQDCGAIHTAGYSEFAIRATRRNKTGNRTNNAGCCKAVVEPLSHHSSDKLINIIASNHTMTTKTLHGNRSRHSSGISQQSHTARPHFNPTNTATLAPIFGLGGAYA
ncbi:host cell division inhibitor Icd-like protein [Pasteurellaceae bacterium HPA106]|uniref:host cell division inhibitor Icd-like protein n=1 Tax=Spirabiliibacterium pneumoniae TaxID=221400 RepID=UPI001AAD19F5|nr:host cell division inhibitor Icd-like protein [Spirabiliibacterium pneumoniae]MBE2896237.1 host cell division inhibitor Icd-like protein [Spirabiliibacterium pneumoniae]